ncbi:hypothetical protein J1N35_000614, partial [Gossypium stocksii]
MYFHQRYGEQGSDDEEDDDDKEDDTERDSQEEEDNNYEATFQLQRTTQKGTVICSPT